jgi:hypothetical protein
MINNILSVFFYKKKVIDDLLFVKNKKIKCCHPFSNRDLHPIMRPSAKLITTRKLLKLTKNYIYKDSLLFRGIVNHHKAIYNQNY